MVEREDQAFWITLWERVTDAGVRGAFRRRRGFCPGHLHQFRATELREHLGATGVAAFLEDLCRTVAADLEQRPPTAPAAACRPCEARRADIETWSIVAMRNVAGSAFRALY